ncbi:FMN-linked oxidoreductase [Lentinula aff. detonsa]|uniref:tRNA-dihydrouridine synthase n=1 Tax=Lentinula aff. detonsa TaxID=2804958 RepID=A0AA38KYI0_9AGAR|nr:FMN-linked oxidoreductase [Lentinula aff. detonsa]
MSPNLSFIAAPMVNQSDFPFRRLTARYGATTVYTQMLSPELLIHDQEYLEFHRRDLQSINEKPVSTVVQLCGNNAEEIIEAGRKIQDLCDAIGAKLDLNLGCPQEVARDGHFGAYLLGQKDWPVVENIVSCMAQSFRVPVSTKLRLCQPSSKTVELAERLEASGSSWITLHARTVSSRRRRQGAADLSEIKRLKQSESLTIPVVSNGNVRVFNDLAQNLEYTGADGLMVGETLLGNPCIFSNNILPDPVEISLEYLNICRLYPGVATLKTIQTHIRHFIDFQCARRPWSRKLRAALNACTDLDDIERLLRVKIQRWRGMTIKSFTETDSEDEQDFDNGVGNIEDAISWHLSGMNQ